MIESVLTSCVLGSCVVLVCVFADYRSCVSVVAECPRLCSAGRDRDLWFERELAAFLRVLLSMVVSPETIPPEFEVLSVLKLRIGGSIPVDQDRYQALFGQYFRFDVSRQKPFFYKKVQKFLRTVCEACIADFDQGWLRHLSLLPLDPCAIQSCSMDRLTDVLVGTLSVLSSGDLCSEEDGAVIVQQYREVASYFKRRWESSVATAPVFEDAVSLWLSYPSWDRCKELRDVIEVLVVGMLHDVYRVDFHDVGNTVLEKGIMLSSLHLVRSWMATGFSGHSRLSMIGFVRHCSNTDMQSSRLDDAVRGIPWDQLVKRGVDELFERCVGVLESTGGLPSRPAVDDYRSTVCDQLRSMESSPVVSRRSPAKGKSSATQVPRLQTEVVLSTLTPSTSGSKRKTVSVRASGRGGNRGQRTGGRPDKRGRATLASFSDETIETGRRSFTIEEDSNEGGSSYSKEY